MFVSCQNSVEKKIFVIYGRCWDGSSKVFGYCHERDLAERYVKIFSKDKHYDLYEFNFFEIDLIDELIMRV